MATEARLTLAAAGNMEDEINVIDPRFQAEALRMLRGIDCGVIENSFYNPAAAAGLSRTKNANKMWKITASNCSDISIGPGMATAYGYDLKSEQTVHLSCSAPASSVKYVFVYLEWDLSNVLEGIGKIKLKDNGAASTWTPTYQNNLITSPTGKYQMLLYRLRVRAGGDISESDITKWGALGVNTLCYPLRANCATNADIAENYKTTGGTIKTKFDQIDARLDALGFKCGAIMLFGVTFSPDSESAVDANRGMFRQGNYVIGRINADVNIHVIPSSYVVDSQTNMRCVGGVENNFVPGGRYAYSAWAKITTRNDDFIYFAKLIIMPGGRILIDSLQLGGTAASIHDLVEMTIKKIELDFAYEAAPLSV